MASWISSDRYLCCTHLDATNDQQLPSPCSIHNQDGHYSPKHHASANLHSKEVPVEHSPVSELPFAEVCAR